MKLFSKKTGKKTLALVLTLVMMLGVLPIIGGDVASATYDHTITFANTDTIHSGSGNSGNQKFIGNSGIEIWGGDELVPSMGSNYLSLNLYSGQYKQFTIQVGANVPNGSNNYNSEGFQLTANQAYKLTINAQAASDSFKLRQNINNTALTNWATFGTTATDQEIEFVLTSHNIVLDTWDTTTGNTLIINSIRIQSLAPPPITNLDGTSDVVIPGTDLVAGSAVTLSQQISTSARVTHTSGYSAGNVVMFNVNLTNGVLITDYESIKITYTGVSGDYNHKDVRLTAVPRASGVVSASTSPSANHLIGMQSTGDASNAVTLEYLLVNTAANNAIDTLDNESEIRFALWIWGGPDAIYEISDITFVKKLCEHIWASNPTHHWCTKTDCVLHTPATHNAVAGSNANCVPCGRVPAFRAVSQIGTVTWTNNFVTRGIGLDAATRTALRTANVESARITIETGAPAVNTEMRFALNSATLGNVGGMQYIEFNSNDIKDKVIDFDLTKGNGINWASGWIEFGLEYTAAASFTFSVELLNAKGEIVFGAGAGDGEEDDPPPVSEAIYEMTVENRDAFLADGQSGGGLRAVGNAKYAASGDGILVSGRTNSWEGLDIMASVFTAGKRYRVDVVISSVGEAQTFSLENTDSPWGVFTQREGTSNVNLIATENASAFLDPQRGVRIRTAGSSVVGDGDFIIHSIRIFEVPPVDVTIPGHVENGVWRPELTPELLDQIISESSGSVARINLSNST
ncbi:MAG: hypothetical protein LBC71_01335, partial [Oscillospiraceae bacterium]|nr:hypothetical protein [Oscillospiraceae bacterium]